MFASRESCDNYSTYMSTLNIESNQTSVSVSHKQIRFGWMYQPNTNNFQQTVSQNLVWLPSWLSCSCGIVSTTAALLLQLHVATSKPLDPLAVTNQGSFEKLLERGSQRLSRSMTSRQTFLLNFLLVSHRWHDSSTVCSMQCAVQCIGIHSIRSMHSFKSMHSIKSSPAVRCTVALVHMLVVETTGECWDIHHVQGDKMYALSIHCTTSQSQSESKQHSQQCQLSNKSSNDRPGPICRPPKLVWW